MNSKEAQARKRALATLRVILAEDQTNPRKGQYFYCYNMHVVGVVLEDLNQGDYGWSNKIGILDESDNTDRWHIECHSDWPRCTKCGCGLEINGKIRFE